METNDDPSRSAPPVERSPPVGGLVFPDWQAGLHLTLGTVIVASALGIVFGIASFFQLESLKSRPSAKGMVEVGYVRVGAGPGNEFYFDELKYRLGYFHAYILSNNGLTSNCSTSLRPNFLVEISCAGETPALAAEKVRRAASQLVAYHDAMIPKFREIYLHHLLKLRENVDMTAKTARSLFDALFPEPRSAWQLSEEGRLALADIANAHMLAMDDLKTAFDYWLTKDDLGFTVGARDNLVNHFRGANWRIAERLAMDIVRTRFRTESLTVDDRKPTVLSAAAATVVGLGVAILTLVFLSIGRMLAPPTALADSSD